ncbi:cobyrinate a,c-diamide synthase [Chlorobium sp. N1]|nr:cobyrinate a,c-diamide synthase [Chlorobium sp. N1]
MVSAPGKSSGKTTITLALARAFSDAGARVMCFKKGPDYIDPAWHRMAGALESRNLDPWMMGEEGCLRAFGRHALRGEGALNLIEGNHGLHDGVSLDGSDSSAGLASLIRAPVLLVVDARSAGRGIAAIVRGMQEMEPRADIRAVVLNRVRSDRQAEKQRQAIERYCGIPVLGALPLDESLVIPERHLGLTTVAESGEGGLESIARAADAIRRCCDMDAILQLFSSAPPFLFDEDPAGEGEQSLSGRARIGVFRDRAFCFYYPENLEALERRGAELVFIDSMRDRGLPPVDGLYIGGGFPESFLEEISANRGLLEDVRRAALSGMPVYAECGGLIYLSRGASWQGRRHRLSAVLPLEIDFQKRPAGHGYLELKSLSCSPWFSESERVRAHEFHYSKAASIEGRPRWQFDVLRGTGTSGDYDGLLMGNLFASYAHIHAGATPGWAETFVSLAAIERSRAASAASSSA